MESVTSYSFQTLALGSSWILLGLVVVLVTHLLWQPSFPVKAPQFWAKDDWPLAGSFKFFTDRYDMLSRAQSSTKSGNFSFYVGKRQVVSIGSDTAARSSFFDTKGLNFIMGNTQLSTVSPPGPPGFLTIRVDRWFNKMLVLFMKADFLSRRLGFATQDTQKAVQKLFERSPQHEEWRVMDTFDELYRIIFCLNNRVLGAFEVAEDPALLDQMLDLFRKFENYHSPSIIIFPWFPHPDHFWRIYYSVKLLLLLRRIVKRRQRLGEHPPDTIQYLLDNGCNWLQVVIFEIGSLFAGQINTGITISWIPIYLSQNPEWKTKIREEVDNVILRHKTSPNQSSAEVLGQLSFEQWEAEFPLINLALRESIRIGLTGIDYRKNIGAHDVPIGKSGEVIPAGAFAVFQIDNVHMNSEIYRDPSKFDPSRYLPSRAEDKKVPHSYLGWGSGRHPCLGKRWATLEASILCAYIVATMEFELSDKHGKPLLGALPQVDRKANGVGKPLQPVYLRYKLRTPAK